MEPAFDGTRLDRFLATQLPSHSRAAWKAQIEAGKVLVNRRPAPKSLELQSGWELSVLLPEPPGSLLPNPGLAEKLLVIYEDSGVAVIDKPAGMPSHPLDPSETDSAANALCARYPGFAAAGEHPLEGGLVHRLDVQTSGLLLAALSPEAYREACASFRAHAATKTYLALVHGPLEQDLAITFALAHHRSDERRMVAVRESEAGGEAARNWRGKPRAARSDLCVLCRRPDFSVVAVRVVQAQMHQIRAHLAAIGHPLLDDLIYRKPGAGGLAGPGRHALHAWTLSLPQPSGPGRLELCAPLPQDFRDFLVTHGIEPETVVPPPEAAWEAARPLIR